MTGSDLSSPRARRGLLCAGLLLVVGKAYPVPQAEVLTLPLGGATVDVLTFPSPGCHLVIWLSSMFAEPEPQRAFMPAIAEAGIEIWLVDLVAAHFLPPAQSSYDRVPRGDLAALIDAALAQAGKEVAVYASSRGALLAIAASEQWHRLHPTERRFLGVVVSSPDVYLRSPQPGEMPKFHSELGRVAIAVTLLEARFSPRFWWLDLTREHLQAAGARVRIVELGPVRAGFHFRPDPTPSERALKAKFPAILGQTLADLGAVQCAP